MKKTVVATLLFAGLFALAAPRVAEGSVSVSISFFHDRLSSQGRWAVAGSYGEVWVPGGVSAGWAPYVDGEWVWTDYGWTWVSYDPWGDIPFHYGTWVWANPYGWAWVPGTIWAPAWVTWAYTDDYIGWAPVPPSFVLSASGYSGGPVVVSQTRYIFVPTTQFVGVNVSTARVPSQRNATIFSRARKVTSYTVSSGVVRTAGPPASHIEKVTGKHLERVSIARAKTTPTTLADAGIAKGRSLHVAAPAKERAQVQKEAAGKRTENAPKEHASTETARTTKVEKSAAAATREKKPKTGGEAKPRIERGEATTREKPAATEHAKPREHGEKSAASAQRAEVKREEPPRAAATEKPKTQQAPPAGQVKKEKPPQQEQGHGHGKKEKEKEKEKG